LARKILLADDSVTAQNMGRRILVEAGYEVVTVNNGSAALKKIAEHNPDLIVLDVYMPGYSGLEVCQRLKAAPDTSTIPVLLTVGKLEPFKAEEAKKVFADAFIVKPFEATELINTLTKLEEQIVPQPDAKPVAMKAAPAPAIKETAKETARKSQEEQEWKDRLRIQAPAKKAEEPEPAPAPVVAPAATKSETKYQEIRAEIGPAQAIAKHFPVNATTEELAAITAAVSALAEEEEEQAAEESQTPQPQIAGFQNLREYVPDPPAAPAEVAQQSPAVVEDSRPAAELSNQEEAELQAISPWANPQLLEEVAAALEQPHTELIPEAAEVASDPATPATAFSDSEVDAALASLGTDDIMSRLHAEEQAHARSLESAEHGTIAGIARWVAEESRLEAYEAAIDLESEMRQAQAVLQAKEEARASATAAQAVAEEAAAIVEAQPAVEEAPPVVEAVSTTQVEPAPEVEQVVAAVAETEISYAAAAAASSAGASTVVEPAVVQPVEESLATESRGEDPELAEAWARWRQIRESVASPQFVSQVADVAAAELQSKEASSNGSKPKETPNSDAIASIVDNVLAQLKPKLVEEIAKQLSEKK
jgi:DNA-binding response OmpR family regulator